MAKQIACTEVNFPENFEQKNNRHHYTSDQKFRLAPYIIDKIHDNHAKTTMKQLHNITYLHYGIYSIMNK